jgi:hypothetical protein
MDRAGVAGTPRALEAASSCSVFTRSTHSIAVFLTADAAASRQHTDSKTPLSAASFPACGTHDCTIVWVEFMLHEVSFGLQVVRIEIDTEV